MLNPFVLFTFGPFVAGWLFVAEFIFTLAMALKCYPLQPGGLLAIEAVALGMTTPESVYHETAANFSVILLLMFMVAGIYFMRDLLLLVFTKLLVAVRSKLLLSLTFVGAAALLSAFLDALTVIAVVIAVATGLYSVYHRFASGRGFDDDHDHDDDELVNDPMRGDLDRFRAFLRSLMMHAVVGTALGGLATLVGEPQNLLIGELVGWDFGEFFLRMAPVSIPVSIVGLLTTVAARAHPLVRIRCGTPGLRPRGHGAVGAPRVSTAQSTPEGPLGSRRSPRCCWSSAWRCMSPRSVSSASSSSCSRPRSTASRRARARPRVPGGDAVHRAAGRLLRDRRRIHDRVCSRRSSTSCSAQEGQEQLSMFFIASGVLSTVSDNVFVATVYITEIGRPSTPGDHAGQFEPSPSL